MDKNRFNQAAVVLGIVIFLSGVYLFAYAGTYSRFWADDYCYSATVKQLGLFRGLVDWYQTSGNRLSTLAVVAFADLFGWRSIQLTTLSVLVLWLGAWAFFLFQLRRLFQWKIAVSWLMLLAVVEVYFAALLAPDRLQTIYWRMGTFHYTLPLALLLTNLGFLAAGARQPGWGRSRGWRAAWPALLSGALGLFAAGLSETFAALQTGVLLLVMIACLVFMRQGNRTRYILMLAAPLAGSLLMMALMSLAPANAWRQAVMPPPDNLLLVIPYSLRFAGDFVLYTLRGQIVPFLTYMAIIGMVALLAFPAGAFHLTLRAGLAWSAVSLLGMYILIVCSFAPSAFAGLAYPAGRALMPGAFALLAGLGGLAFLLGTAVRQVLAPILARGWAALAAPALLVLFCLYPLRAAAVAQNDIARLSVNAARWDARHMQILLEVHTGTPDVRVRQVEVVQSLEDMGPDSTRWVNSCAAGFYGARSISANP